MKSNFTKLIVAICLFSAAYGQEVAPTSQGNTCQGCLPNEWIKDAGATNFFPSISNEIHFAGLANQPWSPLPDGPAPSFLGSFLSAYVSPIATATCHTNLTGLTPNKKYYLKYNIMASKRASDAGYGETGKLELATLSGGVATPFTSQTTTFTAGVNTSKWISKVLEFTPTVSNVRLTFSGASSTGGFINLDIGFNALTECFAGTDQVTLDATSLKIICGTNTDLGALAQQPPGGAVSVVWFTNPTHSGEKLSNPEAAGIGIFYAFKYDNTLGCYNTNNSTAKVIVSSGCFDLSPTVAINWLNFNEGASRDFVVNVFETIGTSTDTVTTIRLTKPSGYEITYSGQSGISDVFGGIPNGNSEWTFPENANFITARKSTLIQGTQKAAVGFKIKRKNSTLSSLVQNLTAVVIGVASNESDTSNNAAIINISAN
ncbi:hypothetical protein DYBT9623_01353 [Dyadobacter sp. CECT 9623]|uniref:Ig-like domain-containing protein n=1 Tax=Dyadobacter linearis TaxID=2823330 RepID=A0ABN7R966_9BACT|nr:hypothetical protein [Dyadobacter sp. CECT 9623]CAG5068621.1 hypothetical protein DYBT9623_01353 [Dyadobacter sp. CECT 9623]